MMAFLCIFWGLCNFFDTFLLIFKFISLHSNMNTVLYACVHACVCVVFNLGKICELDS